MQPAQLQTEPAKACLQEVLSALEDPPVDQAKFDALKAAFVKAVQVDPKDNAARLGQTIIRTVTELNSAELELLAVVYRVAKTGKYKRPELQDSAATWESVILQHSGFGSRELVQNLEESLVRCRLLSGRTYADQSGIVSGDHCRLTSFGLRVCEFLGEGELG